MIFVILGIIILIVSFFVALVSLIREQEKIEDLADKENLSGSKESMAMNRSGSLPKAQPIDSSPWVGEKEKVETKTALPSTTEEVPLPWQEEQEIERIRASINRLKSARGQKVSKREIEEVTQASQEIPRRKLEGEFSLQDELRKRRDF